MRGRKATNREGKRNSLDDRYCNRSAILILLEQSRGPYALDLNLGLVLPRTHG